MIPMTTQVKHCCLIQILYLAILVLIHTDSVFAAETMKIKLATVAPKGSIYHRVLQEMGAAWKNVQGSNSRFLIYPNGTQGSEANTVRRMRIGQLDAAMLSVAGLKEIDESVTALQFMPLMFRSWDEFDYVHEHMRTELEQRLLDKGFVVLFWGEGGWVQFFSTTPRLTPKDYKTARIFQWSGNPPLVDMMKSLDYHPVVLELSDILTSLQTGMIDVVPVAPMWALAFQLYGKTSHMLRMNWVPIVGATVITTRTWNAMRPEARDALRQAAVKAGTTLRAHRTVQDENTIKAMQTRGLTAHQLTPEIEQEWQKTIRAIWPSIRGNMVPADKFDQVIQLLAEYRTNNP
ncbi:MAG: TRAP transporter substrate-binding protein DctP [Gammaproteobacteria bacterium]|nr:TRAP transporter substrate-binding protein DctP [Gammaproteobacteria bacterium]